MTSRPPVFTSRRCKLVNDQASIFLGSTSRRRIAPEAFQGPKEFKKLAEAVSTKIKSECSGVRRKDSYATLGRFDVVGIVEALDPKQIEKAAIIIHAYGHSTTETLVATPWAEFLKAL